MGAPLPEGAPRGLPPYLRRHLPEQPSAPPMNRDEQLREIQKRIALARGYTDLWDYGGRLLNGNEEEAVPRWPMDWCDAGVLWAELDATATGGAIMLETFPIDDLPYVFTAFDKRMQMAAMGEGASVEEAVSRAWCAWRGIDLSDLQ